jgi:hypothetical protein
MTSLDWILTGSTTLVGTGVALVLAVSVVWFLLASSHRSAVAIAYALAAFLFDVAMIEPPYFTVGLQLYPNDVMSMLLLSFILLRSFSRPVPLLSGPMLLWLAFGATLLASLVIGLGRYGTTAGTEVRDYFYYWAVGLYCCAVEWSEDDIARIGRWAHWAGYGLISIALYRWIGLALGFVSESTILEVGVTSVFRALPSHAAFYLAACGLVHLMRWLRRTGGRWAGLHMVVFFGFVLILQHRSVWAATLVGVATVLLIERRHVPPRAPLLLSMVGVSLAGLFVAVSLGMLDGLIESLTRSTMSMLDTRSSVTDRVFGWGSLVEDWAGSSVGTLIFGFPFGHGWRRVIDNRVIEFSPHNFYVDLLLRVGLVGLALMLVASMAALVHAFLGTTRSERDHVATRAIGVILLAALVYYVPYSASYLHGALTGLGLARLIASGWGAPKPQKPTGLPDRAIPPVRRDPVAVGRLEA